MASPQVWFITGCSSGFGAGLAKLALKSGHKVIASSRTPSKTPSLVQEVESLGGTWLQLDVNSKNLTTILDKAVSIYGPIDVLVNNAGYSILGALEDIRYATRRDLSNVKGRRILYGTDVQYQATRKHGHRWIQTFSVHST
jgi:NADP-dependent 3-hydroxy acid dehydrogenase YdfG